MESAQLIADAEVMEGLKSAPKWMLLSSCLGFALFTSYHYSSMELHRQRFLVACVLLNLSSNYWYYMQNFEIVGNYRVFLTIAVVILSIFQSCLLLCIL